jgi:hypothetical protein
MAVPHPHNIDPPNLDVGFDPRSLLQPPRDNQAISQCYFKDKLSLAR